jgi:hypothetical protein
LVNFFCLLLVSTFLQAPALASHLLEDFAKSMPMAGEITNTPPPTLIETLAGKKCLYTVICKKGDASEIFKKPVAALIEA